VQFTHSIAVQVVPLDTYSEGTDQAKFQHNRSIDYRFVSAGDKLSGDTDVAGGRRLDPMHRAPVARIGMIDGTFSRITPGGMHNDVRHEDTLLRPTIDGQPTKVVME
jgi:hypothetical protein